MKSQLISYFLFCSFSTVLAKHEEKQVDKNVANSSEVTAKTDPLENYSSGLTHQFRDLLMSPSEEKTKKSSKSPKHEKEKDANNLKELTQAHIEQLLKFYTKVAEKLLAKNETVAKPSKMHKMSTKHEENGEEGDKESREYLNQVENWAHEHGIKPNEVNTAIQQGVFPGYGNLNYLNAVNFGPPSANAYANALRQRMMNYGYNAGAGQVQQPNCCNLCQCGSNYDPTCGMGSQMQSQQPQQQNGCGGFSGYGAAPNTDANDNEDGYGPDNYYGGGFGSSQKNQPTDNSNNNIHSHLLNSATNNDPNNQPGNFYQVSGQNNGEEDTVTNKPSHFEFANNKFSSFPTNYGAWNNYNRPCGMCKYNAFNVFNVQNDAPDAKNIDDVDAKDGGIFHLVKPKFEPKKINVTLSSKRGSKKALKVNKSQKNGATIIPSTVTSTTTSTTPRTVTTVNVTSSTTQASTSQTTLS